MVQERKRKRKQRSTGSKRTENGEPATNPAGTRSVTCGGGPSWWLWWWTLNALVEYVPWLSRVRVSQGGVIGPCKPWHQRAASQWSEH